MALSDIARGVCAELRSACKGLRLTKSLLGTLSTLAAVVALGLSTVSVSAASTTSLSSSHSKGAGLRVVEASPEAKSPEAKSPEVKSPEANSERVETGKQPTKPPGSSRQKRGGPNSVPATDNPATPEGQNDLIKVMRPKN